MPNDKIDRKKLIIVLLAMLLLIGILYLCGFNFFEYIMHPEEYYQSTQSSQSSESINVVDAHDYPKGEMHLTMIDVGQGDSFLFIQNGYTALFDCGTRSTGKDVVKYLKEHGITKLDYVIGTHPHDDHMGGMYDVITSFEIDTIIMPKVKNNTITSDWYLKLMNEIKTGGYKVIYPTVGDEFSLGDANMKVIGPFEEPTDNINNYSIVVKISFGEMDVLMTGDAETSVEKEILDSGENIDAEILKVGHHGSDTSTSTEFLDAVDPDYALISAKVGNKYNHPTDSTMKKFKKRKTPVYRTDESGTVEAVITSDNVEFDCEPGDYLSGTKLEEKVAK